MLRAASAAVVLRQFYLIRGSLSRVLPMFAWVAVDMVLWGFITRYLNTVASSGINFVPTLLGAVLLWDFFTRVMQGVTMAFFEDVWSRNFLNIFATPLSISEYLAGLVVSSMATSSVGLAGHARAGDARFGLSFLSLRASCSSRFCSCCSCSASRWGLSAARWCCGWGRRRNGSSGRSPPCSRLLPASFIRSRRCRPGCGASRALLPPSYVFDGMRAIVSGGHASGARLLWGGSLALLYILAAGAFFKRVHRQAVRSGLIARYSAESVS